MRAVKGFQSQAQPLRARSHCVEQHECYSLQLVPHCTEHGLQAQSRPGCSVCNPRDDVSKALFVVQRLIQYLMPMEPSGMQSQP